MLKIELNFNHLRFKGLIPLWKLWKSWFIGGGTHLLLKVSLSTLAFPGLFLRMGDLLSLPRSGVFLTLSF